MEVGVATSKEKAVFSAVLPVLGRGLTISRMCRSRLSALLSVMTLTGSPVLRDFCLLIGKMMRLDSVSGFQTCFSSTVLISRNPFKMILVGIPWQSSG